jgi:hypothetical protein
MDTGDYHGSMDIYVFEFWRRGTLRGFIHRSGSIFFPTRGIGIIGGRDVVSDHLDASIIRFELRKVFDFLECIGYC